MMNYKNIDKFLVLILLLSIAVIISIDFWLINIPEKVSWGFEFGKIIYSLSMAYIASYIFYFVTVHIKNKKNKNNLKPYIKRNIATVLGVNIGIHSSLQNSAQPSIFSGKMIFSESEYESFLTEILNKGDKISSTQTITRSQLKTSTLYFLLTQSKAIQDILKDSIIVAQNHYSEFIKIATKILDSNLFRFFIFNEYIITSGMINLDSNNKNEFASWLSEYDKVNNELNEFFRRL